MPAHRPPDEDHRLQALRECCVLDTAPEAGFDEITAIAAEVAATPIALISLIDDDRQWFKSRVGLDAEQTPRDLAFCAYAILESRPLVVPDARSDERFSDNPLVTGPPSIRFYAGFPLELGTGERLGTLCVIDDEPRDLDDDAMRILERLSREAAASLELRRSLHRLDCANRERNAVIEELRETQARLDAMNRAKSEFLANMSHEIRTPMTAILGFLDLIEEEGQTEEDRRTHVETIRRNARHLLGLINDILDLSKIEVGKMTTERIDTDPVAIVREVESLMRGRADEKRLAFSVDVIGAMPRSIRTDPVRLTQILTNLVANAIKFTHDGGVTLRVGLDRDAAAPMVRFDVMDTGIGIAPEQRDRLFDAFEQADKSTTRRFGGTGLGLRISTRLATLLGGVITVESEPGRGSTFSLAIPAGAIDDAALVASNDIGAGLAGGGRTTPEATETLRARRVLIADDGADNRLLLGFHLRKAGVDLVSVEDGAQAVAAVEENARCGTPFDLVVMDMQMPELDGYDAVRTLRARGHDLPVIALTANAMLGDRERCLEAGCDDYLSKPINAEDLLDRCAGLVTRRS